jgi:uncharacterized LabA/DUF88 family protein
MGKIGVFIDNDNFFYSSIDSIGQARYDINYIYDLDIIRKIITDNFPKDEIEEVFYISSAPRAFSLGYYLKSSFFKEGLIQPQLHKPIYPGNKEKEEKEKPASDFLHYIYSLKDLYKNKLFDIYVFVSSDMDLLPLIEEIRKNNKTCMVIFFDTTKGTNYKYIEKLDNLGVLRRDYMQRKIRIESHLLKK